jgi:hypothetical protein
MSLYLAFVALSNAQQDLPPKRILSPPVPPIEMYQLVDVHKWTVCHDDEVVFSIAKGEDSNFIATDIHITKEDMPMTGIEIWRKLDEILTPSKYTPTSI